MLSHIFQGVDLVRIIGNYSLSKEVVSQREERGVSIGPNRGLEVWIKVCPHSLANWRAYFNEVDYVLVVWLHSLL
jgi:hypothetical protein